MNCIKCGQALPQGAAFCMSCGSAVQLAPATPQVIISQAKPRPKLWLWIAAAGAIILAALIGLSASGILGLRKTTSASSLQAVDSAEAPALAHTTTPSGPTLPAQGHQITMPADIRAWLEHLERIERKKNRLHESQAVEAETFAASMGAGGLSVADVRALVDPDGEMPNPLAKAREFVVKLAKPWRQLRDEFNSVRPPQECAPIAIAYDKGLNSTAGYIDSFRQIFDSIDLMSDDYQSQSSQGQQHAREVRKVHPSDVDESFGVTDRLVGEICRKYNTTKWFEIKKDLPRSLLGGRAF